MELNLNISRDGLHIANCYDADAETGARAGSFVSVFEFPGDVFRPGRYMLGVGAVAAMGEWAWGPDVAILDFSKNFGGRSEERTRGVVAIPHQGHRVYMANSAPIL